MNYTLSKLAIGLTSVLAFSAHANATNISGPGSLGSLTTGATVIGNNVGSGAFIDDYTFSVPTASSFSSAVTQTTLSIQGITFFNINNLAEKLYNTSTSSWVTNGASTSIGPLSLVAGDKYDLKITGTATGNYGGTYGGVLAVAAVPEPTESALILSGIAMLGFIAARRKSV